MRILVVGINFYPELTGTGKYTADMVEALVEAGHSVKVITAPPYYPAWKFGEGYDGRSYVTENWAGAEIHRVPVWIPKKLSGLKRLLHLASFSLATIPALFQQWNWRPQLVWMVEPPLMCAPNVLLFAWMRRTKTWLHIQDYEVDAAFELGMLKGRRLRAFVESVERFFLRRFDRVSTISTKMMDLARKKQVREGQLVYFPNWVDLSSIQPRSSLTKYRQQLGIAQDAIVALYSGNMGAKQGLEILADAARLLEGRSNVVFLFCGNGAGREDLERRSAGLQHVKFIDLQPLSDLGELLATADIHLLPQRADAADLVMPSKLTGMLASGRPVVATAREETELGKVVKTCGLIVLPENPEAFANAINELAISPSERERLGGIAREFAETNIDRDAVLGRFNSDIAKCVQAF